MAQAKGLKQILTKQPSDVVLLSSLRTPVTRAVKGGFRDAYDHELLSHVLKATLAANPNLDPAKIDDVAVGVVLAELGGSKAARMAQLHAGFHERTALHTINRACSSGLAAVTSIANMISVGQINVGIGAGMESMTKNYGSKAIPTALWDELKKQSCGKRPRLHYAHGSDERKRGEEIWSESRRPGCLCGRIAQESLQGSKEWSVRFRNRPRQSQAICP